MNIIIVDDHPVVRKGMKTILESEEDLHVIHEAEESEEALEKIRAVEPDLAIVDIELKGNSNGIQLIRQIKSEFPNVVSLVMSMDDGSLYAERSIRAGAKGYIAKEEASDKIVGAIRQVALGELYLSSKLSKKIASIHIEQSDKGKVHVQALSNKEFEIFCLIGQGYKRKEISRHMNMNINTLESHRRKIKEKLSITDSSELSRVAVSWYMENRGKGERHI